MPYKLATALLGLIPEPVLPVVGNSVMQSCSWVTQNGSKTTHIASDPVMALQNSTYSHEGTPLKTLYTLHVVVCKLQTWLYQCLDGRLIQTIQLIIAPRTN